MEYLRYFTKLGAVLMAVIACPFLIVLLLRSYKIPQCFSCGAMKMRASRVIGFWDSFGSALQIRPYRCEGCRERFHAFFLFGDPAKASLVPIRRQRVVKIAFRFRKGLPNRVAIRVIGKEPPSDRLSSPAMLEI